MTPINPKDAAEMLRHGAQLIDVREADEHARERIPGARSLPLSRLEEVELALHDGTPVVFHCRSGARTAGNAARLSAKVGVTGPPGDISRRMVGAGGLSTPL